MDNLKLTENLTLGPNGAFELNGSRVSKSEALEHFQSAEERLVSWPLSFEVAILQDQLDELEDEKEPLDAVLAEAAKREGAARQAHREWYEKESSEIAEAKRQLTAREEKLRRLMTFTQNHDPVVDDASDRRQVITGAVERISGELGQVLAGDRLSTSEVASILSSMQTERRRAGGAKWNSR